MAKRRKKAKKSTRRSGARKGRSLVCPAGYNLVDFHVLTGKKLRSPACMMVVETARRKKPKLGKGVAGLSGSHRRKRVRARRRRR
jgi:hypothetical protein